ncbi:MAG: NTP transferase domain-containing protein, partial [Flavisolibacter sp.]|nr:NTP transferase domain-containing protein [Flavisolibacter sp.]
MKHIALIPARFDATRFSGKLMAALKSKSVIRHTYDGTVATGLFDEVYVVTDSQIIYKEIANHGGKAIMSTKQHESGSDRIAEAAMNLEADVIVNVQGDTPFIKKEPLQKLLEQFRDPQVKVGSLMQQLQDQSQIEDPNFVKVCIDKNRNAL